ncbi:methyltransferase FGSG_00040 [Phoenix dactylifera]|uniref:Methyltransferase FGSG_00040 n=1 Tax=Phoenix dactylifera TaxID=42345 RepID=A0A8B7BJD8_PHODC|nr:methyltransferase FGSG_00040 [Phoenix dactylifera]
MTGGIEEEMHLLRSRATELSLREDWKEYINLYTHLISLCDHQHSPSSDAKLHKTLCLALSNRAEARSRLRDLSGALEDCDRVLEIDPTHLKAIICKGKILLDLDLYTQASGCFQQAFVNQGTGNAEALRRLLGRCRRLEAQSRTGALDISDWLLNGFGGNPPELAEYVGPVEVRRSANGGRGLFATKSVEAGTPLVITKAIVLGRGILPETAGGPGENARMVMWKDFVDKILDATEKCSRTLYLIYTLSAGDEEGGPGIPVMGLFSPGAAKESFILENREPDVDRILKVLDVNCLTEEAFSAKVLGKNSGYCGVGLWILPSFVNHSCSPNARRLHIGDRVVVHASRDVKAGEEITFAYFDVFSPLSKRREMSKRWKFHCHCERCRFEEKVLSAQELREMEMVLESGSDMGGVSSRLEEGMRRWMVKGREKGFLRASFWTAYYGVYESEKLMRKWGRQIPAEAVVAESVSEAVGGDERVLKVLLGRLKKKGGIGGSAVGGLEMDKAMRLGRGTYGKVAKKQGMRALFELALASNAH